MGARQPCKGCLDTSGARPLSRGRGSGLPTWEQQATSRRVECGAWHERQQGCDTVQQRFDGAGPREVEEDPVLVLFGLSCHFAEGEEHGRGLGLGQRGLLQRLGTEGLMQALGGTGQQEPHGVREAGRRRGAGAGEGTLDRLDMVFAGPTRAVDLCIHPLRRGGRQGGDDQAGVGASRHDFRLEDDPPGLGPGCGAIGTLGIETAAVGRARVMGLREGGPLLGQAPRLLRDGVGVAQQDRMAGQAEDAIDPGPLGEHLDHLRCGQMAVPPDQEMGPGPVAPQEGEESHQDHCVLRAGGPRATFQNCKLEVKVHGEILLPRRATTIFFSYTPIVAKTDQYSRTPLCRADMLTVVSPRSL
jgi:hypothetical protein